MLVQSNLYLDPPTVIVILIVMAWAFVVVVYLVYDWRKRKPVRSSSESDSIDPLAEILDTLRIGLGVTSEPPGPDVSSSPVGGACLECGSTITEETNLQCPDCGVARKRCTICQRFVAGGQELLACPLCHSLSHSNEIIAWVQKKNKCPYCGRGLKQDQLIHPDEIQY